MGEPWDIPVWWRSLPLWIRGVWIVAFVLIVAVGLFMGSGE